MIDNKDKYGEVIDRPIRPENYYPLISKTKKKVSRKHIYHTRQRQAPKTYQI